MRERIHHGRPRGTVQEISNAREGFSERAIGSSGSSASEIHESLGPNRMPYSTLLGATSRPALALRPDPPSPGSVFGLAHIPSSGRLGSVGARRQQRRRGYIPGSCVRIPAKCAG